METSHPNSDGRQARLSLMVRQIRFEAVGIQSYELVHPAGDALPPFTAGAHIDVHLPNGILRQYSLCNSPSERHRYVIAVLRDEKGRGGSKALHESLRVQDFVTVGYPRNNFALVPDAKRVLLLAGGIGVTPLKSMAHALEDAGIAFEFHYCAKNADCVAFDAALKQRWKHGTVRFHYDNGNPADGLDIAQLLRHPEDGTHVFYCGPGGFMHACANAAALWPAGTVHCEHFKVPEMPSGAAGETGPVDAAGRFTLRIASSGKLIDVPSDRSIAEALEDAGMPIETSCQSGLCGTCKLRYLEGEVDHRDCILGADEQAQWLTACVSRARSEMLVLDM